MKFQEGDRVKVGGELGRGEGHIAGFDGESGMYRVRYGAVEATDTQGHKITVEGQMGYAPVNQIRKRRG